MKRLLLALALCCAAFAQTASYPSSVATDTQLKLAKNNLVTTLRGSISASDTVIPVSDATRLQAGMLLTVDTEIMNITGVSGNLVTVTRGFDNTTAATHRSGVPAYGYITAWHHNALAAEIKAIESTLGPGLANLPNSGGYVIAPTYSWTAQEPGGSLTASSLQAITLTPCPAGVSGAWTNKHYVYLSGGTGTAEAVLIKGGTCTSGAASGTIIVEPAYNHSGAWTVGPATGGVQEAINVATSFGTAPSRGVLIPAGRYNWYGQVWITGNNLTVQGTGGKSTTIIQNVNLPAFRIDACSYCVVRGVEVADGGPMTSEFAIRVVDSTAGLSDIYTTLTPSGVQFHDVTASFLIGGEIRGALANTGVGVEVTGDTVGGDTLFLQNLIIDGAYGGWSGFQPAAGIRLKAGGGTYISNCDVIRSGSNYQLRPSAGQNVRWTRMNNVLADTGSIGVHIDPDGGDVDNTIGVNVWTATNLTNGWYIGNAGGGNVRGVQCIGCTVLNNYQHGAIVASDSDVKFSDSRFCGNGISGPNTYNGFVATAAANNFEVINSRFGQCDSLTEVQAFGVFIASGAAQTYSIQGNHFRGNNYPIVDAALGKDRLVNNNTPDWINYVHGNGVPFAANAFDFPPQAPGTGLTATVPATITMEPCPAGLAGTDSYHYLYISGGVGTPEAVLVTGGTCTSGLRTGTVQFTPAQTHTGAYTIRSATAGMQEAALAVSAAGGGTVSVGAGTFDVYATTRVPYKVRVSGTSREGTVIRNQMTTTGVFYLDAYSVDYSRFNSLDHATIVSSATGRTTMDVSAPAVVLYGGGFGTEVTDVTIKNHNIGIQVRGTVYAHIERFTIQHYGQAGIYHEYGDGNWISRGEISNATTTTPLTSGAAGIWAKAFNGAYWDHIDIIGGWHGVKIQPDVGDTTYYGFFNSVLSDTVQNHGWYIDASLGGSITTLELSNCWASLSGYTAGSGYNTSEGRGLFINGDTALNPNAITVLGGRWRENGGAGIQVINGRWVKIIGAEVGGNSQKTLNLHPGIGAADVNHLTVQGTSSGNSPGTYATGKQSYGLALGGGSGMDFVNVSGNDFSDNNSGTVTVLSAFDADAQVSVQNNLGVDSAWATLASGATVSLTGLNSQYKVTGTTTIATINGGWVGRTITLVFTDASPGGVSAAGNIGKAQTATQYERVVLTWDGTKWY